MKHFNNRSADGFSFIEVVMTLALVGAVLTPVFMLQYNVLNFLPRSSDALRSIFLVDAAFSQAAFEHDGEATLQELAAEKKYEDPAVTVLYRVEEVPETSPLKKIKNVYVAHARANWRRAGVEQEQSAYGFVFRAPPEEDKEKGDEKKSAGAKVKAGGKREV